MLRKIKTILAIAIIIVSLPYIITIFINGSGKEAEQESDGPNALLKAHCIKILSQEVSSDYSEEMLKAQAVMVRTTIYKEVQEKGKEILNQEGFGDISDIESSWYKKLESIWDETEGQVIMYGEELALVPFHQISNGKTRLGSEVLGSDKYPYLKIKECPKDVAAKKQIISKFIDVKGAKVATVDSAGYVLTVSVGEETVNAETFRGTYQLASTSFELQEFEKNTRVVTKGVGHGLGLSQYTANEMAKEGKTYTEILQFFFEGTEIREVAEIFWETE